jgi:hypothetical protein
VFVGAVALAHPSECFVVEAVPAMRQLFSVSHAAADVLHPRRIPDLGETVRLRVERLALLILDLMMRHATQRLPAIRIQVHVNPRQDAKGFAGNGAGQFCCLPSQEMQLGKIAFFAGWLAGKMPFRASKGKANQRNLHTDRVLRRSSSASISSPLRRVVVAADLCRQE